MENEAKLLLDDTIAFCQRDGVDERVVRMLMQSHAVNLADDRLSLEAPSRFAIAQLERNRPLIEGYLEQIAFGPLALDILPPSSIPEAAASATAPQAAPSTASGAPSASAPQAAPAISSPGAAAAIPAPAPESPRPASPLAPTPSATGGVRVKSTLSPEEFRRLMGKSHEEPARGASDAQPDREAEAYPHVGITSKFTFDTFVYGEENKHAYHSAQRFAAFADEPDPYGKHSRFFVYGKSGLGKTHLLLAIKNFLAENKPQLRVKYANSQAYIDDFINEISHQKSEGRSILRAYHEADVLIIDDVQNIIGKQASIEYFFSLLDEFMRDGKKIAIASDRAPKDLGVDARLSSRLSPNMLCLVSEPGYEMKYAILKRYYETVIMGDDDLNPSADGSLLSAFQGHEGQLTDEQLRHMAEISGNNIRELESFCERCASLSFERENAGRELTAEDIDGIANEYFDTAHKVIRIDTVQSVVEEFYHVSHDELIGPKRSRDIAFARHVAVYLANSLCELSSKAIGEQFGGRDHSTVINSLKVVEKRLREDHHVYDDLQKLKGKITMRS